MSLSTSAEPAAYTRWKDNCFRICSTIDRLSILLVAVVIVDSDHSTDWTYRGNFSVDKAAEP